LRTGTYDKDRSALDNYRKNRPVNSMMAEWLESQFPIQFEEVRQSYKKKIEDIDGQVAELEAEGLSVNHLQKWG
jgi:hypothetical protein